MKLTIVSGALCALLLAAAPSPLRAEAGEEKPSPAGSPADQPGWKKHGKPRGPEAAGLDREEAQRLAAAREKAKNDPTVRSLQAARDSVEQQFENAMKAAILAADPSLAPTLEKISQSRERAKGMRDRFESLTPEQRQQLQTAREATKNDPAVVAAREKMKSAGTPEARREAGKAMHEAMKAAMIKQNPDLAPLLEKLGPPPPPPHGGGGGGGRMGSPPFGDHDGPPPAPEDQ